MKRLLLFISILWSIQSVTSQVVTGGGGEAHPELKTNSPSIQQWMDYRFGMFIHWGPVTLRGEEISWSRGIKVPADEYDRLYAEFNPILFNAKVWVKAAKDAGMKYLVITAKHHDGFCLWNSGLTSYNIMNTTFHRDILKELAGECEKQGILFCTYYSIADWHHPDYTTRHGGDCRPLGKADMSIYIDYMKKQLAEIVSQYHTHLFWFDGEWEKSWTHKDGMDLYAYLRGLDNTLIINNRVDKGGKGMNGMSESDKFAGDFGTPEQEVGAYSNKVPWESCITIGTQWSWKPNDQVKSAKECIHTLVKTAGCGGNLLLNISPMFDGRIEQRQLTTLQAIGKWTERNAEAIYGTKGGPYLPNDHISSTAKGDHVYVLLMDWPRRKVMLPLIPGNTIRNITTMEGKKLPWELTGSNCTIFLPGKAPDSICSVINIQFEHAVSPESEPLEIPLNKFGDQCIQQLSLITPPSPIYKPATNHTLTDGVRGSYSYLDGKWLGFEGEDVDVVIELDTILPVKTISLGFLQSQEDWIFLPSGIETSFSIDGKTYSPILKADFGKPIESDDITIRDLSINGNNNPARFVRLKAVNIKTCPAWHKGKGGKAWLFTDELKVTW